VCARGYVCAYVCLCVCVHNKRELKLSSLDHPYKRMVKQQGSEQQILTLRIIGGKTYSYGVSGHR